MYIFKFLLCRLLVKLQNEGYKLRQKKVKVGKRLVLLLSNFQRKL